MAKILEFEVEIKSSADKFWGAIRDFIDLFPKIFPDEYKSIEVLEGDGKSVGSIRLLKYAEGLPIVTFSKERIEVADETNMILTHSVIDGELTTFYKNYKSTVQVVPKDDGSCLAKLSLEYEKTSEEVPEPNLIQELIVKKLIALDAYLLNLKA